jgi:DNA-binding response OmpR family regulator
MPENAKIAWFEDDTDLLEMLSAYLKRRGHDVIRTAQNEEEAEKLIDEIIEGELELDAIIMDGRLIRDSKKNHGSEYSEILRAHGIETTIIGYSGDPAEWSDIEVNKLSDRSELNDAIKGI